MATLHPPRGYEDADIEQHALGRASESSSNDVRSAFQHDVDRILYATEFRGLGGRTQVISSDQRGNGHNRLTHSIKVAQVGRRLGQLLAARAANEFGTEVATPDLDLIEAACLLHDIGHPVFGHIGERTITAALDTIAGGSHPDGYQANAQNLRIATYLAVRVERGERGLNLTRAALDSAIKYPWFRGDVADSFGAEHWGVYQSETSALLWTLNATDVPPTPETHDAAVVRPVEEQIMDWADEVTYACHDLEDFFRAGLIPLDRILALPPRDPRVKDEPSLGYETLQFLEYLKSSASPEHPFDGEATLNRLTAIQNILLTVYPYESTQVGRGRSATLTTNLLGYFLGPEVKLEPTAAGDLTLTRYRARLEVPSEMREICRVITKLIRCYVIDRPGLATQQHGQMRIVRELVEWYQGDPIRLLPAGRLEEFNDHSDALRASADHVSSLTEGEAVMLHRRMSGTDYGQLGD